MKRRIRSTRRTRGLTLIEILVALAMLSLALIALIPLFLSSVNTNASSNQLSTANTLAREKLDEVLMYPSTDPRLLIANGSRIASYVNDLPTSYRPSTGETSPPTPRSGPGWYPYPCVRTYTVQAFTVDNSTSPPTLNAVSSTVTDEKAVYEVPNAPVPYYDVKLITVTVRPSSGPFPGLRRTVQSAYVRFRSAS